MQRKEKKERKVQKGYCKSERIDFFLPSIFFSRLILPFLFSLDMLVIKLIPAWTFEKIYKIRYIHIINIYNSKKKIVSVAPFLFVAHDKNIIILAVLRTSVFPYLYFFSDDVLMPALLFPASIFIIILYILKGKLDLPRNSW